MSISQPFGAGFDTSYLSPRVYVREPDPSVLVSVSRYAEMLLYYTHHKAIRSCGMFFNFAKGEFAMNAKTKKASVDTASTTQPNSLKDAAYRFARAGETAADLAQYVITQDPAFPETVSDELKADLYAGFTLRAHELWGQDYYKLGEMGSYIKQGNSLEGKEMPAGCITLSVAYVYSFSQQEFGQLKSKDPQLHSLVKVWRDKFSKYAHNNLTALKRAAKTLLDDGKTRERSATDAFDVALRKSFDSFEKRVKNAENRGDDSAHPARYLTAVSAFWKVYNG